MEADEHGPRRAVVVMGVAGCGKSTIAGLLAERLGWPLGEADDLHPPANVAKMASGTPLTDDDRWPWLDDVRAWIDAQPSDCVLTCSALKRDYRDVLRKAEAQVLFAHLDGTVEQLRARISGRVGHFMPPALLDSQLATLEPLEDDEAGAVLGIAGTPDAIADAVMKALRLP
ncbi:gluconate kinase, SKI family [Quadrisphaera granulorum]|uniref:Gluconokinase n=1 Tax=Quadrisphaera granulorum TaxID=317664 RepID=A0A316AB28_9ACTN|nr:gluconate kinase (SKI family) [Quadrisphaera granulorum]SZE96200.1 gluconate kinase, SKI family [Quadrisphaera granulorum]